MSVINKIIGSFDYCNKQKQTDKEKKKGYTFCQEFKVKIVCALF